MKMGRLFDQSRLFLLLLERVVNNKCCHLGTHLYIKIIYVYKDTDTLKAKDEENCTVQTLRLGNLSREVSISENRVWYRDTASDQQSQVLMLR